MTQSDGYVLIALCLLPLGTAMSLFLVPTKARGVVMAMTGISSLVMLALSLYVFFTYKFNGEQFQGVLAWTWMQNVVLPLYVLDRTGKASVVGVMVFAQLGPLLFLSIPAGVIADRFDRRRRHDFAFLADFQRQLHVDDFVISFGLALFGCDRGPAIRDHPRLSQWRQCVLTERRNFVPRTLVFCGRA